MRYAAGYVQKYYLQFCIRYTCTSRVLSKDAPPRSSLAIRARRSSGTRRKNGAISSRTVRKKDCCSWRAGFPSRTSRGGQRTVSLPVTIATFNTWICDHSITQECLRKDGICFSSGRNRWSYRRDRNDRACSAVCKLQVARISSINYSTVTHPPSLPVRRSLISAFPE